MSFMSMIEGVGVPLQLKPDRPAISYMISYE